MSRPSVRAATERRQVASNDASPAASLENLSNQVRDALAAAIANLGSEPGADLAALTVERPARPIAPAQLATAHGGPPKARQEARAMYERCLHHYRTVVRVADLPLATDDVGAALANFVAANIEVLQGSQATAPMRARLERQLVAILRASPAWQEAPSRDRQAYVEQLGILSVLMTQYGALAQRQGQKAIDHVRGGARGYLRQLLGLEPDALMLGEHGLALRGARMAAPLAAVAA